MSKKIAPALRYLMDEAWGESTEPNCDPRQASRELRALLAVARADARDHGWMPGSTPCRPDCARCRALARLDRLSSGTGKRKAGTR